MAKTANIMERGLPFDLKNHRYNQETESAIEEARLIMAREKKAEYYSSARALFDRLDSESEE